MFQLIVSHLIAVVLAIGVAISWPALSICRAAGDKEPFAVLGLAVFGTVLIVLLVCRDALTDAHKRGTAEAADHIHNEPYPKEVPDVRDRIDSLNDGC